MADRASRAATAYLQFECLQPGRDQGGRRESRSQEGEPSLSGLLHAGDRRRRQHRTRRALLYHRRQRRGAELRRGARARRTGVFARAGTCSGRRSRAVHGQQSDRDGVGERKCVDEGDAAQLGHRLFRQPGRRARTCRPGLPFASSRHERRPHRPVDTEHGCRQDPARRCDAILQGSLVQPAGVPGGMACVCRPVGHRQDCCAHIAGLGLHRGRLRALRRQHVFPAAWPG